MSDVHTLHVPTELHLPELSIFLLIVFHFPYFSTVRDSTYDNYCKDVTKLKRRKKDVLFTLSFTIECVSAHLRLLENACLFFTLCECAVWRMFDFFYIGTVRRFAKRSQFRVQKIFFFGPL